MKQFIAGILMYSCLSMMMGSCTKASLDKIIEQQQGGNASVCDTSQVRYSTDIVAILKSNCYSCHGNGSTGGSGGISLDGYNNLLVWAKKGYLVGNVTHAPGFIGMPYELPALDSCSVNKIVAWVNQGSVDN